MPTDVLIYAIVAAVMVFWLRNILGTKHGEERKRPNPFDQKHQPQQDQAEESPSDRKDSSPVGDVIDMITGEILKTDSKEHAEVEAGLVQIALADRNFEANQFKENASDAFSIIVTAFADGDRDTLRDLCAEEVYRAFDNAIRDREARGETVSTEIHAVRKADIVAAGVENKRKAFVTIRFTADETYVIRDTDDAIIAGHPDRVTEMTDQWTFSRDVKSSDPRWFLSKTEDDVIEEDGKTPLPDAG